MGNQRERSLPSIESVRWRFDARSEERASIALELRVTPWWWRRRRAQLRNELTYLEGLVEGLRLSLGAAGPPANPGKPTN